MIHYKTGKCGIFFAFSLHGSVFPKAMLFAFPNSILAYILHTIVNKSEHLKDVFKSDNVSATVLSGFTFILGFLIVFRSQQAYSRWWEGGTLMQRLRGEWFNAFSSLLAFCSENKEKQLEVDKFSNQLARLTSLLYGSAINQVADVKPELRRFEFMNFDDFDLDKLDFMRNSHDPCEILLQWIQRLIVEADQKKIIQIAPPILSRVFNQLGNGIVILNNARKISDYPIPFALAQMITIMLMVHWVLTVFLVATSVHNAGWACVLCFVVVFSFWSIHFIGEELEQPFGIDPNDLPVFEMQADLNCSLVELLDERARSPPFYAYRPEDVPTPKDSLITLSVDHHIDHMLSERQENPEMWHARIQAARKAMAVSSPAPAPAAPAAAPVVAPPGVALPASSLEKTLAEALVPVEAPASQQKQKVSLTLAQDLRVAAGPPPEKFGNPKDATVELLPPGGGANSGRPASKDFPDVSSPFRPGPPRDPVVGGRPQAVLPTGGSNAAPVIWLCGAGNFMRRSNSGRELQQPPGGGGGGSE